MEMEPSLRTTTLTDRGLTLVLFTLAAGVLGTGYFFVKKHFRKHKKLLSPRGPSQARRRAEERRRFITLYSDELRLEIIEAPPGFNVERRFLEHAEVAAQRARLNSQFDFDELLLAERVIDALIVFQRHYLDRTPLPAVHVFPDSSDFGWKIVLETDFPEKYKEYLLSLHDWFAIRIDVAPAKQIKPFGRCAEPFDKEGVAGGMFLEHSPQNTNRYRVTCSHVVAPACASVFLRSEGEGDQTPDVALIKETSRCFNDEKLSKFSSCHPASGIELEVLTKAKSKVTMKRGRKRRAGYIASRVRGFPVGDRYYRFPHCMIFPYMPRILLALPFWRKPFSQGGDSGSWLFEEISGDWVGMLVAGDRSFLYSYVIEPEPLLDYCRDSVRTQYGDQFDFQPLVLGLR